VGGTPSTAGSYDVYSLGVWSPQQVYYLNAINQVEAHASYPVDYTFTVPIQAGAQVRLRSNDPNCSMIKNCDINSKEGLGGTGICNPISIPGLFSPPQPFNGEFIVLNVVSSTP